MLYINFNVQTYVFLLVNNYVSFTEIKNLTYLGKISHNYLRIREPFCQTSKNVGSCAWVLTVLFIHVA